MPRLPHVLVLIVLCAALTACGALTSTQSNYAPADGNTTNGPGIAEGEIAGAPSSQQGQPQSGDIAQMPASTAVAMPMPTAMAFAAEDQSQVAGRSLAVQATQTGADEALFDAVDADETFTEADPVVLEKEAEAALEEPQEPADMFFDDLDVNPFHDTEDDQLSTFAMDVDTASFTLARGYLLDQSVMPPPNAIRPEEFINYVPGNYPSPEDDAFAIYLDAAPAPFGYDGHYVLRVGLQGKYIAPEDRDPALLIFVIDVSGSMSGPERLGMVKQSLGLLVEQLREDDRVAIVVYSDRSRTVLDPTSGANKDRILNAIDALGTEGSTNVEDGLRLGYELARDNQRDGEITRVIVLSDGVGNVGNTGPDAILNTARDAADDGITLSTIGFGMSNYNDIMMERLANDGDGNYYYVDTLNEARRVFVNNLTSTLQVVGYDAKVQVDFDPEVTDRYRLIGYENRAVADSDFRNDTVDAGEVGAGHSVTALYELALEDDTVSGTVAEVFIRYEDADTREVVEISREITTDDLLSSVDEAPTSFRAHIAAAELSEMLRESRYAEDGDWVTLLTFARPLEDIDTPEAVELIDMIRTAGRIVDQ